MTFDDAWQIVKSKGCVNLPPVQQKVHGAWRIVEPHLLSWERMHLRHEMWPECSRGYKRTRGFDFICKVIEDRIYRNIEFKGPL